MVLLLHLCLRWFAWSRDCGTDHIPCFKFRPYDARMHVAVADIYARLNQHPLALKGYTSALATQETPMLPYTLSKIASSYLAMSRMKEAAYYYMLVCGSYMKDGEGHKRNGEMTRVETEAARWLAGYFRSIGCLEAAFKFAELIETTDVRNLLFFFFFWNSKG